MAIERKKGANEKFPITIDFGDRVASGATISSATGTVYDLADGSDVSSTLLVNATLTISGDLVTGIVQNGTLDHRYSVRYAATCSDTCVLEEVFHLLIIEKL